MLSLALRTIPPSSFSPEMNLRPNSGCSLFVLLFLFLFLLCFCLFVVFFSTGARFNDNYATNEELSEEHFFGVSLIDKQISKLSPFVFFIFSHFFFQQKKQLFKLFFSNKT